jgi:phage terminase large subunit-like protein
MLQAIDLYADVVADGNPDVLRELGRTDLFFLIYYLFGRKDIAEPWLYDRCREVEKSPDEHLDLWAREHYKSTIITYAKSIQDILVNPDVTIGIFSHTRPIAKGFLDQIKRELEMNETLQKLYSDVLYREPKREAARWSVDSGLIVRRETNPKEATVEAWGLVDGQPTSKHFDILVYDDVVTRESVTTPEQIQKVTDAWRLSLNLGARGGKVRYIGTRYHFNDTYRVMLDQGSATPRIYPATEDGSVGGRPILLEKELLARKRTDMGPYVFSCQMLQNPTEDSVMGFDLGWLNYYDVLRNYQGWNFYILVDPASGKKKYNDYTVQVCIGLAPDRNYYLVDGVRDRMNLTERTDSLFNMVRKWRPIKVGYEKYGMQGDIEHLKDKMSVENYRIHIQELKGSVVKEDRIRRLVPIFEQDRFWMPHRLLFTDRENKVRDFIREFIDEEYLSFPTSRHDDMLDCVARILDPDFCAEFPKLRRINGRSIVENRAFKKTKTEYDIFS